MGKRSTTSTKSGKFMNPTDQARKEQRKKELKKNKKQRMAVRTAVLKGKDAQRIITELDEVDDMELNPNKPPALGEKVIKDKRKKLIETLERVLKLYEKEDPEYYGDVKEQFDDYIARRIRKEEYYEEVKSAERVDLDEIPMPDIPLPMGLPVPGIPMPPSDIPMPQAKSILKKPVSYDKNSSGRRKPPGPPPGMPPPLSDSEDEGVTDAIKTHSGSAIKQRTIRFIDDDEPQPDEEKDTRFTMRASAALSAASSATGISPLQAAMLKMAGQKAAENESKQTTKDSSVPGEETYAEHGTANAETTEESVEQADTLSQQMQAAAAAGMPVGILPNAMMFHGPGGAPVIRLPPGAQHPPGMPPGPPPGPPPGLPPSMRMHRLPMGMPPRLIRPPTASQQHLPPGMRPMLPSNVLSAPPSIQKRPTNAQDSGNATISAKPQIKHVIGDVTRFTPTALKVKREDQKKQGSQKQVIHTTSSIQLSAKSSAAPNTSGKTKDDAYESFMKEMQGIM